MSSKREGQKPSLAIKDELHIRGAGCTVRSSLKKVSKAMEQVGVSAGSASYGLWQINQQMVKAKCDVLASAQMAAQLYRYHVNAWTGQQLSKSDLMITGRSEDLARDYVVFRVQAGPKAWLIPMSGQMLDILGEDLEQEIIDQAWKQVQAEESKRLHSTQAWLEGQPAHIQRKIMALYAEDAKLRAAGEDPVFDVEGSPDDPEFRRLR
jgi:hypothetical protein